MPTKDQVCTREVYGGPILFEFPPGFRDDKSFGPREKLRFGGCWRPF